VGIWAFFIKTPGQPPKSRGQIRQKKWAKGGHLGKKWPKIAIFEQKEGS